MNEALCVPSRWFTGLKLCQGPAKKAGVQIHQSVFLVQGNDGYLKTFGHNHWWSSSIGVLGYILLTGIYKSNIEKGDKLLHMVHSYVFDEGVQVHLGGLNL